MKVSKLIEQLKEYPDDAELYVAYWDKEWVVDMREDIPALSDNEWRDVVSLLEEGEWHWQSSASEDIDEVVAERVKARSRVVRTAPDGTLFLGDD
jgi:hypothetical protein